MPICDMHLHTRLSSDADQREDNCVDTFCKNAVDKGIKHIAFTEHRDIIVSEGTVNCDMKESKAQCETAKEKYSGSLDVMFGTELAHAHTYKKKAAEIIDEFKPDFVLSSLHNLEDGTDFYCMDFSQFTDAELVNKFYMYIDEILKTVNQCDFDSLAHSTYPLRYFRKAKKDRLIDITLFHGVYSEIFKVLISRGKSLEVNCSSFSEEAFGQPMPNFELIDLYLDLGGKMFTMGSDSHDANLVGRNVDKAQDYLKSVGVDGVYIYHNRQPEKIKI